MKKTRLFLVAVEGCDDQHHHRRHHVHDGLDGLVCVEGRIVVMLKSILMIVTISDHRDGRNNHGDHDEFMCTSYS